MHVEGTVFLPIPVSNLSLFIAFLDQKGLAPTTITTYMSAIGHQHKLTGVLDTTNSFLIQKLMQASKYNKKVHDIRLPITEQLLLSLCQAVDFTVDNAFKKLLFRTMMSVAFWGFFRVGELTDASIRILDVSFNVSHGLVSQAIISLHKYKHNRGGTPFQVVLDPATNPSVCPVQLLVAYIQHRGSTAGPLFIFRDGTAVNRLWFNTQLDVAVRFCGLDPTRYKSHSFRIGAATTAALKGLSDAQIRFKGRWHSDAFKQYIRPTGV